MFIRRAIDPLFRLRTVSVVLRYVATRANGPGRTNPAHPIRLATGPEPSPGGYFVGVKVANAVSRSVRHSSPSHSSTLQLIMIE